MTDAANTGPDVGRLGGQIEAAIDRIVGGLSIDTVFSRPVRTGDRFVITAAAVQRAGGFGFGGGSGAEAQGDGTGNGGGGGGGGSSEGRPVAVIDVGPDGVQVLPVVDFTKIGLTAVAAILTALRFRGWRRRR